MSELVRSSGRGASVAVAALALLCGLLLAPAGRAEGTLDASLYGPVGRALLAAMHAKVVPCADTVGAPEVCFEVEATGVAVLAEEVEAVAADNAGAGLRLGPWTAGNGVHAVSLSFEGRTVGVLEVFLAEVTPARVRGMLRLTLR
jgi:hypothetical protein